MAMGDFCKSWYVTLVPPGGGESCGDEIAISCVDDATLMVQCCNEASHIHAPGTYQPAGDGKPERIELGSDWITFTPGVTSEINYGSSGKITGSWTASDHPWQAGGRKV